MELDADLADPGTGETSLACLDQKGQVACLFGTTLSSEALNGSRRLNSGCVLQKCDEKAKYRVQAFKIVLPWRVVVDLMFNIRAVSFAILLHFGQLQCVVRRTPSVGVQ